MGLAFRVWQSPLVGRKTRPSHSRPARRTMVGPRDRSRFGALNTQKQEPEMDKFLIYDFNEGIVTLTMNRPEKRNALSETEEMLEFVDICAQIEHDPKVRVVILTGAGSAFSSGGNVKHMRDKKSFSAGSPLDVCESYREGIQQIPLALYHLSVPTIAAINGHAIGAGLDLACMCDLRS